MIHRRAAALLSTGTFETVTSELSVHISQVPFDERIATLQSAAFALMGRRSEAIMVVRNLRQRLLTDLGVNPSSQTVKFEAALERDESDLLSELGLQVADDRRGANGGPTLHGMTPGAGPPSSVVGRSAEWVAVSEALASKSGVVAFTGEEGIGKTMLATAFANAVCTANRGLILTGACRQFSGVPLEPIVGALKSGPPGALTRWLRLHPAVSPLLDGASTIDDDPTGDRVSLVLVGFIRTILRDRPLVLLFDDLHWASSSTLLAIRSLIETFSSENQPPNQLVVLLAYRPIREPSKEFLDLSTCVLRQPRSHALSLTGMNAAAVADLLSLEGIENADAYSPEVLGLTGGIPLFVAEYARQLKNAIQPNTTPSDSVPPLISSIVLSRVTKLSRTARRIVEAVAVANFPLSYRLLAEVVDVSDEASFFDAIDECITEELLAEGTTTDSLSMRHGFFGRAVAGQLRFHQRSKLHESIGRALAKDGAHPADVALHFYSAGSLVDTTERASASVAAGEQACAAGAFDDALNHVHRAIATLGDDGRHPGALAHALSLRQRVEIGCGDVVASKSTGRLAVIEAAKSGEVETAVIAALSHASYGDEGGHDPDSFALLDRVDELAFGQPALKAKIAASRAAHLSLWAGRADEALAAIATTTTECRKNKDFQGLASCLWSQSLALVAHHDVQRRVLLARELVALGRAWGNKLAESRGCRMLALTSMQIGDVHEVHSQLDRLERFAEEPGLWYIWVDIARWRASLAMAAGEHQLATASISDAHRRAHGVFALVSSAYGQQILQSFGQNTLRPDDPRLDLLERTAVVRPATWLLRSVLYARDGDQQSAEAYLTRAKPALVHGWSHRSSLGESMLAAFALQLINDRQTAEVVAKNLAPYSGQIGIVAFGEFLLGPVDAALAIVQAQTGDVSNENGSRHEH